MNLELHPGEMVECSEYCLRLRAANELEVWENNLSQHYLIIIDNRKPDADIVFFPSV